MNIKPVFYATMLAISGPALASPVVMGFDSSSLGHTDDGSSDATALGFTVQFGLVSYDNVFVNNNGYLTFGTAQSGLLPGGLDAGYAGNPIIAPFYDDVDTTNPASGVVTYDTGTYAGQAAFAATWSGVGYFDSQADNLNTFQVILTSRMDTGAGNFDVTFNYGSIQWDSTVNTSGAAAGFNAADSGAPGSFTQLDGSLVPGAFLDGGPNALAAASNDGVPGQYVFSIRDGVVAAVPEPGSAGVLLVGLVGAGTLRRRPA